jgi:hypothetical protein
MAKWKYKADFDLKVNTLSPGDTFVTRILGLAMVSDGSLVLIDCKNKSIKVFKPDWYEAVIRHDLDEEPTGIASNGADEIIVTFAHKLEVRRYRIGSEKLNVPLKRFKVNEKPFSISFSKNTLAIEIGEGSNGSIIVTDMDGDQLKKISGNRRHFGMFTGNTIRLAHDHDAGCLYVVDIAKEYVNCVDYEGNIKWQTNIKGPRGIVINGDSLFVASKTENAIFQIDRSTGKYSSLLTSDDQTIQPRFIACQQSKEKLAVEVGGNVVNMYKCKTN